MIPLLHTAISERFRSAIQIHVYITLHYISAIFRSRVQDGKRSISQTRFLPQIHPCNENEPLTREAQEAVDWIESRAAVGLTIMDLTLYDSYNVKN